MPRKYAIKNTNQCRALTTTKGTRCKNNALPGVDFCIHHGGEDARSLERTKRALIEAQIGKELVRAGWQPVTDPIGEYAKTAGEIIAFKEVCRDQINHLQGSWVGEDQVENEYVRALVQLYERSLDRSQKVLNDMLRIGLDAAALGHAAARPSQEQAAAFGRVLDGLLQGLELTPEQQQRVPAVLSEVLQREGLVNM